MIKVTANYHWKDGARFDRDYYRTRHLALTRDLLTPLGLIRLESDLAIHRGGPLDGQIIAASQAYFPDLRTVIRVLKQAGPAIQADVANYTDILPETITSEVVQH